MKNTIPKGLKYNELVELLNQTGYIKVTKEQVISIDSPMVNVNLHLSNFAHKGEFWYNPDEQIVLQADRVRIPFKILMVVYMPVWFIICVCFGTRTLVTDWINASKPGYVTVDRSHLDDYEHEHLCKLLGLDEYLI